MTAYDLLRTSGFSFAKGRREAVAFAERAG
jgi:hypothetical protein